MPAASLPAATRQAEATCSSRRGRCRRRWKRGQARPESGARCRLWRSCLVLHVIRLARPPPGLLIAIQVRRLACGSPLEEAIAQDRMAGSEVLALTVCTLAVATGQAVAQHQQEAEFQARRDRALAVVLAVPLAQPVRGFDHLVESGHTTFFAHRLVGHLVEKSAADVGLAREGVHASTCCALRASCTAFSIACARRSASL